MTGLNTGYKQKLLGQLANLKFIKSNSFGVSGIKNYPGCMKLKITNTDENLYATQRYLDSEGNILVVFDKLGGHSDAPYQGKVLKTTHGDFKAMIYETGIDVE